MKQYIDKDALVAEIEKRRDKNARNRLNLAAAFEDNYLLSFLDTLEVKEINSTDAFIEKVENFLEMLGYGFTITDNITHADYDKEQLIEDFKNYIMPKDKEE